jgi:hypothetical protein
VKFRVTPDESLAPIGNMAFSVRISESHPRRSRQSEAEFLKQYLKVIVEALSSRCCIPFFNILYNADLIILLG